MSYSSGPKPLPPRWERRVRLEAIVELVMFGAYAAIFIANTVYFLVLR